MLNLKVNHDIEMKQLLVENAEALFDFVNRNRNHLKKWLNWINSTQTIEDQKNYLKTLSQDIHKSSNIDLGIWNENKIIGIIHLTNIDRINKVGVLGYCIDENYQNRGIATECSKVFLDFVFKKLQLHRIEIKTAKYNLKSKAVAKRLGFKSEGILRQAYFINDKFVDCELFSKLSIDRCFID